MAVASAYIKAELQKEPVPAVSTVIPADITLVKSATGKTVTLPNWNRTALPGPFDAAPYARDSRGKLIHFGGLSEAQRRAHHSALLPHDDVTVNPGNGIQQLSAVAANRAAADKALASAVAALDGEIAAAELQAAAVAAVRIRASFPTSTSEVVSASCDSSLMDAVTKARRHADFDVNTTVLSQLHGAGSNISTNSSSSPKTGSRLQARAAAAHAQDDSDPWYPEIAYSRIALCSKCGTQRAAVACAECAPLLYCLKCSALAHAKKPDASMRSSTLYTIISSVMNASLLPLWRLLLCTSYNDVYACAVYPASLLYSTTQIEKREHVLSQYIKPPPPPRIAAHHSLGYHVKKGHTWIANQTAIQQRQNVKVEEEKEELAAAVRIQAFNRAHTARAAFTKLQAAAKQRQADVTEQKHNAAAVNIQRIWRAYTVKLFIATNGIELHPKDVEVDDTGSIATTGSTTTATAAAAAAATTSSGSSDSALVQALAPAATVTTAAVPAAISNELVLRSDSGGVTAKADVPVHDVAADKALLRERAMLLLLALQRCACGAYIQDLVVMTCTTIEHIVIALQAGVRMRMIDCIACGCFDLRYTLVHASVYTPAEHCMPLNAAINAMHCHMYDRYERRAAVHQLTSLHAACEASFLKDLQWTADCRVPLEHEKSELQLKLEKLAEVQSQLAVLSTLYKLKKTGLYWTRKYIRQHHIRRACHDTVTTGNKCGNNTLILNKSSMHDAYAL
eukprot:9545-Heterococcus_DN1.PRE.2